MIKVEAINGAPSQTPIEFTGSHFDGEYFYFFESEAEKDTFYNSLNVWNKEAHIAEINALHKAEFERRYKALDYEAEWDVVLYAEKPELGYQEEANTLLNYWTSGWDAIKAYSETVTEETAEDPQIFVNNIENGSY
jgi:hypothetical protein